MIRAKGIFKDYVSNGTKSTVLHGIDLQVQRGEFVAIMGKSGSGKSTLLHVLSGLDFPTQGEVWVNGEMISNQNESALAKFRRSCVGFIHQFFNLVDSMTAYENVILPALLIGMPREQMKNRVSQLFSELGIQGLERKLPGSLSGGQRQRVAIARAIINRPQVVFADEPTGSLDSNTSFEIMNIFTTLHQNGSTIVMVTHDAKVASQADRIIHIRDGRFIDESKMEREDSQVFQFDKLFS